ncbi:MAG: hypothetical protein IT324_09575 [Anaerolineae bacterium]|nr:hypothetical protein [Anaerolineae bacterium]
MNASPELAARDTPARHRFMAWVILCCLVGSLVVLYVAAGLHASGGSTPVMPLDDTYIHFQYARSIAEGNPFRYNPDQPPTSGATSLLYPILLAVGYTIGFQGELLAWWALAIGALCWIGSAWLIYRTSHTDGENERSSHLIALAMAILFTLTGSLSWAFMSGMETGLMIVATLLTLWYVVNADRRGVIVAGTLAALTRPEGLAIGVIALIYIVSCETSRRAMIKRLPLYAIPVIAGLLQPLINLLTTGSATASGMQAKSYLYNVPADTGVTIQNMLMVAGRIWRELFTGFSPDGGWYIPPGLLVLAVLAVLATLMPVVRERKLYPAVVVLGWLLALTLAISTLETAFWQFKRYQQPVIALLFPLAAWVLTSPPSPLSASREGATRYRRVLAIIVLPLFIVFSLRTTFNFLQTYAQNVHEVASSQIPMARYVTQTIPPNAIIGVHDIGVVRYLGNHTTYDVVGLTTPGAARAWRNGPGSTFEQMVTSPWRPDYFAIYPDARGLTYLADTGLSRDKLAAFPSTKPQYNVASATNSGQYVYKADWTFAGFASQPHQPASLAAITGMKQMDVINVADLASEDAHHYRWWEAAKRPGFATELYEIAYASCQPMPDNPTCKVLDGGRLITGGEEMTIATQPGQDLIWITRVHPRNAATLGVSVNGKQIATRVIPPIPGQWMEIATLIPGTLITGTQTQLRIEANITDPTVGHYMPYYHWFYQGTYHADTASTLPGPGATFNESIILVGRRLAYNSDQRMVSVDLSWQLDPTKPTPTTDAKVFIHLYDPNGKLLEGVQIDQRPGGGVLPPANWLPGLVRDSYTLTVPKDVLPGTYQVAIGLYDPVTLARFNVLGDGVGSDRRLFIGTVEIR